MNSQQADGYNDSIDELANAITVSESNDDPELVEELADTVTIEQLLDTFILEISDILTSAVETSLEGNPVRTHVELIGAQYDIVDLAHQLRLELVSKVAVRSEEIAEQGGSLRKQVVDEQLVTPLTQARRPLSSIEQTDEEN